MLENKDKTKVCMNLIKCFNLDKLSPEIALLAQLDGHEAGVMHCHPTSLKLKGSFCC
jgi:hypothetical protein